MKQKVFILGFQKTGTTSLELALKHLGYRVYSVDKNLLKFNNKKDLHTYIKTKLENWDAVQDMPWPLFYKDLHEIYPNAKFILTYRNSEDWFKSVVRFFGSIRFPFHKKIYNVPCAEGYESEYRALYDEHNRDVKVFFEGKINFMVMEAGVNFKYNTLCEFLNLSNVPEGDFPHGRNNRNRKLPNYKLYRDIRSIYWNYKKGY